MMLLASSSLLALSFNKPPLKKTKPKIKKYIKKSKKLLILKSFYGSYPDIVQKVPLISLPVENSLKCYIKDDKLEFGTRSKSTMLGLFKPC